MKDFVSAFFKAIKSRKELIIRPKIHSLSTVTLNWNDTDIADHLSSEDWKHFSDDLEEQIKQRNDRSVVILSHSFLDDRLRWLHEVNMDEGMSKGLRQSIFSGTGPLASYRARCDMALGLGLLREDFHKELGVIGQVRNKFAHDFRRKKLSDPDVSSLCDKLGSYIKDASPISKEDPRRHFAAHCFIAMASIFTMGQMILGTRKAKVAISKDTR